MDVTGAKNLPQCPVETTMLFLKDKNTVILLGYILLGISENRELQKRTAIAGKIYQATVDSLLKSGLIAYDDNKNIFPTDLGKSLKPVILAMANWGEKYQTQQAL